MEEEILGLYDTFLGRFKFFRKLIHVMKEMYNHFTTHLSTQVDMVNVLKYTAEKQAENIAELTERIEAQDELIAKLKPVDEMEVTGNFTQSRPADIVDKYYRAYNNETK